MQGLISRLESAPSEPQSPLSNALRDIPATGDPDERHLDAISALSQPGITAGTKLLAPVPPYFPPTTVQQKPKSRKPTFEQRRARILASPGIRFPPSIRSPASTATQSIESRLHQATSILLTPPPGYYNPLDNTYTLDLEWAMDVIGPGEFVDKSFAFGVRKVLRPASVLRQQVAGGAGLPREIAAWLSGSPSMGVHRFSSAVFRIVRATGVSLGVLLLEADTGWSQ